MEISPLRSPLVVEIHYQMNFTKPVSLALEYITVANSIVNSNSEFILKSPTNKTITVLNPNNQLLLTPIMMDF
jgi:hypothetical protein